MKTATCLIFAAAALAGHAAELRALPPTPDLGRAYVTIPYAELRALWEAGQPKAPPAKAPAPAPVAFLVHRAEVRLQLNDAAGLIDANFEVETLGQDWQTIPLLGGEARLDKAEAGERSVIWDNGYALLTNQPGKTPVALHLATRGSGQLIRSGPLKFKLGNAAVKRLTISGVPAGLEVRVNGQPAVATHEGGALFHLPGEAGEVSVELAVPKIEEVAKPLPAITLSAWRTQSQVLVRPSEGWLRFLAQVVARADDGSGLEMSLVLPATVSQLTVAGEDLADYSQSRAEDGRRLLRVRWKTRDVLDRQLKVTYALPQSPLAEQWTLPAPSTPDEKEARHLYAILPAEGLELKGEGLRPAVESRRLPEWMRGEIGGATFVTAEAGTQLSLQTHWLPTIATAEAIVTEAKAQLRLVEGASHTSTSYTIKHQAPLAWRLDLPANVELLSCTVGGASVQPILREKGTIEFALPAPTPAAKGLTTVQLVYTAQAPALDPVSGQISLELPRTPLFIEHLEWSIAIPSEFEISAFDGNVTGAKHTPDPTRDERSIAFRKDFCRAERPSVALFYQRRSLEK